MKFFVLVLSFLISVSANAELFPGRRDRAIPRQVALASQVIQHRMASPYSIPPFITDQAQCVAALRVVKVGFIWGGEGSTGLVSCRTQAGWSTPSFFNVGGVNFGLQIGVQFMESVLVFLTDYGRQILSRPTFKVGTDLSFAAGPAGQGGGNGLIPSAHVLTYDNAAGLYAGVTINGFVLAHAPVRNQHVYQQNIAPTVLLTTPGSYAPPVVRPFVDTMNYYIK